MTSETAGSVRHEDPGRAGGDILLRDRFPAQFAAYREHFVDGFEHRHYNHRSGHVRVLEEEPWRGRWQRAKARGRDLAFPAKGRAGDRILEKHLSLESWNRHAATGRSAARPLGDYYWLGLYAGRTTRHLVYDVDNHGGGTWYRDEAGRKLPLADLPLRLLGDVSRLHRLRHPPHVLMTSSANLGLHAYVQFDRPHVTSKVLDYFAGEAAEAGLSCELYPNTSNCLRRPMGHGSVTLSGRGVLRSFAEQMDHYLDPTPLPPIEDVAEMLIDLWVEKHSHLASCYAEDDLRPWEPRIDVPGRIAAMNEQVDRIRAWVKQGCPDETGEEVAGTRTKTSERKPAMPGGGAGQRWPEDCRAPGMRWLDRVHRLASGGLWLPDTLNPALLDLATWLLAVELYDAGDREERVVWLLGVFCATRHNGMSDRLAGVEDVEGLPEEVRSAIAEAIDSAGASVPKLAPAREGRYRKPLKVAHLLTGEGEPNGYAPGAAGDSDPMTREDNHPFLILQL